MRAKYLAVFALLGFGISAFVDSAPAQTGTPTGTLSGTVVIEADGEPARGTHIWINEAKSGTSFHVEQDKNGYFQISLPEGYYFVFIGNLGLVPYSKEVWLQHGKPVKLAVKLEPDWDIMQDTGAK
jgi:hypothetical protein